jgi:hypothetical protein
MVTPRQLENMELGGSAWESKLLFTDTSSTYEEALGLSRKGMFCLTIE